MSMSALGFWIRIFLAEGNPSGLKFVEKSNWSGHGFVCPRPRFPEVKGRNEFQKAGVYILIGPSEYTDLPRAYIGEADPIRDRLETHHSGKEFWTVVYGFVSKDTNLNKAHIQYLEARLVLLAKDANRCVLDNGNMPTEPSLSEADKADAEGFLREMLLCFPVLGVSIFDKPEVKAAPKQLLYLKNKGVDATGYESADGFVVRSGSTATIDVVESAPPNSIPMRKEFLARGIFIPAKPGYYQLTQDYEFSSPSIAAGTLIGANISGREAWKTAQGRTLKELQESSSS
jgi:hypothetical protein